MLISKIEFPVKMLHHFQIDFNKLLFCVLLLVISCTPSKEKKQAKLFNNYCASCHIAPEINSLPKYLWEQNVLPEMAARMGIKENGFNPFQGLHYEEMEKIYKSEIFPAVPTISKENWKLLREYILESAPDSLEYISQKSKVKELTQFKPHSISLDTNVGSFITYLKLHKNLVFYGDIDGKLNSYNVKTESVELIEQFKAPIVAYTNKDSISYFTEVGKLDPTELLSGKISIKINDSLEVLDFDFHRPVHTLVLDLNNDGVDEIIVSEFGNLTGELSIITMRNGNYEKNQLLNQPGIIKVVGKDMNADGKLDLVVLTTQGDESITILYQQEGLKFVAEKSIRFSPVYGSSWFELIDYDADGDYDILTVNGDNADKTFIHKPYHGFRLHINNGNNEFKETYFYPMNGATRLTARDFDNDGDIDIGLISTFPDYENKPEQSFVYLENINSSEYKFEPNIFDNAINGRWLLMDSDDIDGDGDFDIVLSSFSYSFSPVPRKVKELWSEKNVDLMVLENLLY